jgi:GNAT superfamily N-acetyltransferase
MIQVRAMSAHDLAFALRLSQQAGWNQTERDWQRSLDLQPDGCFVAEVDAVPAGTTTTCIFGEVAWIAMVLVDEAMRRCGIGMALMRHALAFLDGQDVATVRLDATPLGQPLYERLGFVEEYQVARYGGVLQGGAPSAVMQTAVPEQWQALAALDRAVTGTDRSMLLFRLFAEEPADVRVAQQEGATSGFIAARTGSQALQVGPCIAAPEVSPLLLIDAWGRHAGRRVFVDIPVHNTAAIRQAEAQGLTVQRYLTRMRRGPAPDERRDWLAASFGPEKG